MNKSQYGNIGGVQLDSLAWQKKYRFLDSLDVRVFMLTDDINFNLAQGVEV